MADDLLGKLIVEAATDAPASLRADPVLTQIGVRATDVDTVPPDEKRPTVGRYQILGELGRGTGGRVLEAFDPELRRSVAIKIVASPEREMLERFVAEARVTAQLEHPGIVPIHDFGITIDGELFMVMKRVRGRTLFSILASLAKNEEAVQREWTRHRRLTGFVQICRAVAYAHDRGVVHRDLKPSNLMFGAFGEALVVDWGIARVLKGTSSEPVDRFMSHHTLPGQALGTIGYMSPEQMLGAHDHLGPQSDVWSLGVILFELVAVRRGFKGSLTEVAERAMKGPLSLAGAPPEIVPPEIGEVITRATSPILGARYPNAAALAEAVDACLGAAR